MRVMIDLLPQFNALIRGSKQKLEDKVKNGPWGPAATQTPRDLWGLRPHTPLKSTFGLPQVASLRVGFQPSDFTQIFTLSPQDLEPCLERSKASSAVSRMISLSLQLLMSPTTS